MGLTKPWQNPNCLFLKDRCQFKRGYDLQFCMNSGSRLLQGLLFRLPVSLSRFAEFLVKVMNGCSNVCSISNTITFISTQSKPSHHSLFYPLLVWLCSSGTNRSCTCTSLNKKNRVVSKLLYNVYEKSSTLRNLFSSR